MKVRFQTVDVDGLQVFYRSTGDPGAPTVLLLHGFPSANHMFRDLIPILAGAYHVVAPDLPDFGMTEPPDGGGGADHALPSLYRYSGHRGGAAAVRGALARAAIRRDVAGVLATSDHDNGVGA